MTKKEFRLTYPWSTNGYKPETVFTLSVSEDGFLMHIRVMESDPKREYTEHFSPVCLDSCVEWFVKFFPHKSDLYFNFEINAIGTVNAGLHITRANGGRITHQDIEMLNVKTEILENQWTVSYIVPFKLIKKYIPEYVYSEDIPLYANFYKCGGRCALPHYGIWNPMPLEKPDFHKPEYFGKVYLKKG